MEDEIRMKAVYLKLAFRWPVIRLLYSKGLLRFYSMENTNLQLPAFILR